MRLVDLLWSCCCCTITPPVLARFTCGQVRVSSLCCRREYLCDPAMRLLSLHRGGVSLVSDFSGHGKTVSQGQPQNDKSLDSGLQPDGATCRLPITVLKPASGSQPPASQPPGFAPAGSGERPMAPLQVVCLPSTLTSLRASATLRAPLSMD